MLPFIFLSCAEENTVEKEPFVRLAEDQKLESTLLNRSIEYAVLLPEEYDESGDDYPVVYLLHGYGDNETAWYKNGNIRYYVDLYSSEIAPMIYVMPQGFNRYYVDKYSGSYPYMQMIVKELVPTIDELFRTKKDKSQRAVMGYSMGGYGALILPAMNPDVFTISVPLSMSFRTDEQYISETQGSFDVQWAPNFGPGSGVSGINRLTNYFKARSPFHFFNQDNITAYQNLKMLIDCGDDEESLSQTNDMLHTLMRKKQIKHEYRVRNGGHSFDYWRKSYPEALKFISNAVRGIEHPAEPTPISIGTLITTSDYEPLEVSAIALNVLKPIEYSTTASDYPVLYFIHQYAEGKRTENVIDVFSLLRNAMTSGKLPNSIVVEIPASASVDSNLLDDIATKVDASLRTKKEKNKRVLIGNGLGGAKVTTIVSEKPEIFSSCFLFGAHLTDEVTPSAEVFYYLDITGNGVGFSGYNKLYIQIRAERIGYEYRVRQGGESFQSFLNGLSESLASMKGRINN